MDLGLGRLAQLSYPVSDIDRSVAFFEGLLGLAPPFRPHDHMAFFDLGGVSLMLERSPETVAHASILYLACDDVGAATAELARRGVEIVSQPHLVAALPAFDLWMSFFKDPDGHLLALHMQAPKVWKPG
jgi:methylmalonyl-CoA/ethylmalonyl-CoA epimerase